MKHVQNFKLPTPVEKIRIAQAEMALGYKLRIPSIDKKLEADLNDIFEKYDPSVHVVGVKSTHDYKTDFKDKHSRTVQYIAGNVVSDPKKFDNRDVCGNGLHFSFGHSAPSMMNSLVGRTEKGHRYHLALLQVKDTVIVENNKFKVPSAEIVFTGSFKDCHRLLQALFGSLPAREQIVSNG